MRPIQYKRQYINLRVEINQRMSTQQAISDSNTYTIRINKYRSGISNLSEKSRIMGIIRRNGYTGVDGYAVSRVFNGKASVTQCQQVITALIDLCIPHGNLQDYCDTYFGLDCSGFVNRYFEAAYGLRERTIASYYQRGQRRLRVNFEDFRSKDVLVWCHRDGTINNGGGSAKHIAVIDSVRALCAENMEATATVVESTGTVGLVHSNYTFFETRTPGVYRVHRPLKPSTRNYVKVVPVI